MPGPLVASRASTTWELLVKFWWRFSVGERVGLSWFFCGGFSGHFVGFFVGFSPGIQWAVWPKIRPSQPSTSSRG